MRILLVSAIAAVAAAQGNSESDSRFGVDYVYPFVPQYQDEIWPKTYAEAGLHWVNFADVSWGKIEPLAPQKKEHKYFWNELDKAVAAWQKHGFHIVISLRTGNGWFSGAIKLKADPSIPGGELFIRNSDRLPTDMDSYRDWMRALVERYDCDGTDDMPGLVRPILHYQIGNEYGNPIFWSGTIEDYGTLLKETGTSARTACKDVKIVSNGIRWNDMFHNDPEAKLLETRWKKFLDALPNDAYREVWKHARDFGDATVALAGTYDILDAGGNGPYPTASRGYMTWVQRHLKTKTVIWDAEARSEPQLAMIKGASFNMDLDVPDGQKLLNILKMKNHAQHDAAVAWYRAEQSRILAQVFVTRFAAGFEKVFMGMACDWDGTLGALATPNPFIGILDKEAKPWPAYHAMKLLVRKIDWFAHAERVSCESGVELYKFTFASNRPPVWVAWLAEDRVRGMNDDLPMKSVRLKEIKRAVNAFEIPTTDAEAKPVRMAGAELELTPTPVILEEETFRLIVPLFSADGELTPEYVSQLNGLLNDDDIIALRAKPQALKLLKECKKGKVCIIRQSLADIQKDAEFLIENSIRFHYICYNPEVFENSRTPKEEIENVVESTKKAAELAKRHGAQLILIPDSWETLPKFGAEMAKYADIFAIQCQRWQLMPDKEFRAKIAELVAVVRKGNPNVPVIAQLSTAPPALERTNQGKDYTPQTADQLAAKLDCIRDLFDGVGSLVFKPGDGFEQFKGFVSRVRK